mmetsp:Transcript_14210/g.29182  ORF Transcript_14210/g.29182 Transcript_14210/m.29182 type:complete len:293 (-) Transcript_14210:20-898(-)
MNIFISLLLIFPVTPFQHHFFHPLPATYRKPPLLLLKNPLDIESVIFSNTTDSGSSTGGLTYEKNGKGKVITFSSSLSRRVYLQWSEVGVKDRDIRGYLALPASQYSLLGSEIERVSFDSLELAVKEAITDKLSDNDSTLSSTDNLFTVTLPTIRMFGSSFTPSLYTTVSVSPYPEARSKINILHCTLDGDRMAKFADGKFGVDCSTVVEGGLAEEGEEGKGREWMEVTSSVLITCPVPVQFKKILPSRLLSATGSKVMSGVLRVLLPKFLDDLKGDYELWRYGKDEERAVP